MISSSKLIQNNKIISDFILLYSLFFFSLFLIYFMPVTIIRLGFLGFLFLAYNSKKDYLWIAFLLIILSHPGGFFFGVSRYDLLRSPIYTLFSAVSIQFEELLVLTMIIKAFVERKAYPMIGKNNIIVISVYLLLLLIFSIFLGVNTESIILTSRNLLPWFLIIAFPRFMNKTEYWSKLCYLLLPISLLSVFAQFWEMKFGYPLVGFFKKNVAIFETNKIEGSSTFAARVIESPYLLFLIFIFSLFFLISPKKNIPRQYLLSAIFLSALSIYLTATRGWIISFMIMTLLFLIVLQPIKNLLKNIVIIILSVLFLVILMKNINIISIQMERSFQRFETVGLLLRGDITAGGNLRRLNERSPIVMKKYWESPIFGFGFSNDFYKYEDSHVGNQTLLLNIGVLGYLFMILFFFKYVKHYIIFSKNNRKKKQRNWLIKGGIIFFIGLVGIVVIHSSSTQLIGFNLSIEKVTFITLFLAFGNFIITQGLKINRNRSNK